MSNYYKRYLMATRFQLEAIHWARDNDLLPDENLLTMLQAVIDLLSIYETEIDAEIMVETAGKLGDYGG